MLRDGINRFCMALADNVPGVSKCKSDYRFFKICFNNIL